MGRDILKNSGRMIFFLLILLSYNGLYAVEIDTELVPTRISAGEAASLQIKINGKSGKITPVKIPEVEGLQISFSGSSASRWMSCAITTLATLSSIPVPRKIILSLSNLE